jgi:hypothetical protein
MYPDVTKKRLNELITIKWEELTDRDKQVYTQETLGELGSALYPQIFIKFEPPPCQNVDIERSCTKRKREDLMETNKKQGLMLLSDPEVVEEETALLRKVRDVQFKVHLQEEKNFVGEMENFLCEGAKNDNEGVFLSKTLDPEHLLSFI